MLAIEIRPQAGPQEAFLATSADGAIYGGQAGGGKSFGLLLEPTRHYNIKGFGGTIFRRTSPEITSQGGLWEESYGIYRGLGGITNKIELKWSFPAGSTIKFSHLQYEDDKYSYQGAQICYLGFDELTHFTETQFWYLQSRNRSVCGVIPYWRATCNPDPDSWVAKFISWWIDQDTGYAIPERAGKIRWYLRISNQLVWADTKQELIDVYGDTVIENKKETKRNPQSLTFIPASLSDNKILQEKDPGYASRLDALHYVERMRLKHGNWKIKASAGNVFKREWFKIVGVLPVTIKSRVRFWDMAATEPSKKNKDPDWTVGALLAKDGDGIVYVEDIIRFRKSPGATKDIIKQTAQMDEVKVKIRMEQEGGASGKTVIADYVKELMGFDFKGEPAKKDKVQRASPLSSYAEAKNVKLVAGDWNRVYLDELENFPDGAHDDQVDASSGGFQMLVVPMAGTLTDVKPTEASQPITAGIMSETF